MTRVSARMIVLRGTTSALAAAAIASLPASGQTQRSLNTSVTERDMPDLRLQVLRPTAPTEQTVVLRELPASMVRLARTPGWATTRQPRARPGALGPGAGGAAYVERIANSAGAPSCALPGRGGPYRGGDTFDFRPLARGFRVTDVRIELLSPPFALDSAALSSITYTHTNRDLVPSAKVFDGVLVRNRYGWQRPSTDVRIPVICWIGYRLHVTVRGPAGIDPITGNPIRRSPVN